MRRILVSLVYISVFVLGVASLAQALPPGLEKKVDNGGTLPPGWEKKINPPGPAVPEPASALLFGTGLLVAASALRHRTK